MQTGQGLKWIRSLCLNRMAVVFRGRYINAFCLHVSNMPSASLADLGSVQLASGGNKLPWRSEKGGLYRHSPLNSRFPFCTSHPGNGTVAASEYVMSNITGSTSTIHAACRRSREHPVQLLRRQNVDLAVSSLARVRTFERSQLNICFLRTASCNR